MFRPLIFILLLNTTGCAQLRLKVMRTPSSQSGGSCSELVSNLFSFDADTLPTSLYLPNDLRQRINSYIHKIDKLSKVDRKEFLSLLDELPINFYSPEQLKLAEEILKVEKFSDQQKKAIFLITKLGIYENSSSVITNNYSWMQIRRKAFILKMVGFSLEQRRKLLWNLGDSSFTKLENLFFDLDMNKDITKLNNQTLLESFKKYQPSAAGTKRISISKEEANFLLDLSSTNPVSTPNMTRNYDPKNTGAGFCFGRAMAVQIEAISRGVAPDAIKKVFAVGDLINGSTKWRYHVATVIKGEDGTWWAIDPIFDRVKTLDDWAAHMDSKYNKSDNMKIMLTNAERIGPNSSEPFVIGETKDFNHYFYDLLNYFHYRGEVTQLDNISTDNFNEIASTEVIKAKEFPENAPRQNIGLFRERRRKLLIRGVIGGGIISGGSLLYLDDSP